MLTESTGAAKPVAVIIVGADTLLAARPATAIQLWHACAAAGYDLAVPATWGDELIAAESLRMLTSHPEQVAVMCSCPRVARAVADMPFDLSANLVATVAPPVAAAKYLRRVYGDRRVHITYAGACPAAADSAIDAWITPPELLERFDDTGIVLQQQPELFESTLPPDRRRHLSQPGGLPAVEQAGAMARPRRVETVGEGDLISSIERHLAGGVRTVVDLAPRAGCACSGAIEGVAGAEVRMAVTALEPPRSARPVMADPGGLGLSRRLPVRQPQPAVEPGVRPQPPFTTPAVAKPERDRPPAVAIRAATRSPLSWHLRERALPQPPTTPRPEPRPEPHPSQHPPQRAEPRAEPRRGPEGPRAGGASSSAWSSAAGRGGAQEPATDAVTAAAVRALEQAAAARSVAGSGARPTAPTAPAGTTVAGGTGSQAATEPSAEPRAPRATPPGGYWFSAPVNAAASDAEIARPSAPADVVRDALPDDRPADRGADLAHESADVAQDTAEATAEDTAGASADETLRQAAMGGGVASVDHVVFPVARERDVEPPAGDADAHAGEPGAPDARTDPDRDDDRARLPAAETKADSQGDARSGADAGARADIPVEGADAADAADVADAADADAPDAPDAPDAEDTHRPAESDAGPPGDRTADTAPVDDAPSAAPLAPAADDVRSQLEELFASSERVVFSGEVPVASAALVTSPTQTRTLPDANEVVPPFEPAAAVSPPRALSVADANPVAVPTPADAAALPAPASAPARPTAGSAPLPWKWLVGAALLIVAAVAISRQVNSRVTTEETGTSAHTGAAASPSGLIAPGALPAPTNVPNAAAAANPAGGAGQQATVPNRPRIRGGRTAAASAVAPAADPLTATVTGVRADSVSRAAAARADSARRDSLVRDSASVIPPARRDSVVPSLVPSARDLELQAIRDELARRTARLDSMGRALGSLYVAPRRPPAGPPPPPTRLRYQRD